jgi:MFS family permease
MSAPSRRPHIFYGWYVLAASFVILFLNAGGRIIIGVMVKPMAAEFGWSRSAISAAIFLNMAVYAVSVIVTGRLYDRYGPKWIIAGSALLFSAGFALMAVMGSLWEFLLYYGVLNAAGMGGTTVALFGSLIGNWFEKRRGLAVSLAFAGNCFGQFLLTPVFSDMIVVSGWRSTSLWIAGLSLVVTLILTFGVIRGDPERFGLQPYGRPDRDSSVSETRSMPGTPHAPAGPRDLTLAEAMRTRSLWLFTMAMFACGSADSLITTHLVPLVTDYGLSTPTAASMLAWLGLLSLAGILLAGPASDAIGNKTPIVITFALRVALFVMLLLVKGAVPFWIFSLGFGFTLLVTAPLNTTLVGALYGVTHIGFISGFVSTVHMMGGGLGAYLGGVVFDSTGDYDLAFLVSAGMAALALACTLLIREKRHSPPGWVVEETRGMTGLPR